MKVLIATDSFKDALPAQAVCAAIAEGFRRERADLNLLELPLADGGEGTAEILTAHLGGSMVEQQVHDPLGRVVLARYGWVAEQRLAFIDMAQASGLPRLGPAERDPLRTSTEGTGQLIRDALRRGARRIVLGIGGSATNEAGMGMAHALGFRFHDAQGQELEPVGGNLEHVAEIDTGGVAFPVASVEVEVLTDVDNPLCGPRGASRVYAPQKGAGPATVATLERGMRQFADRLQETFGRPFADVPGAGAAGGLGAGALAFLGADLRSGIEAVMAYTGFEEKLRDVQLVVTGEGRLDDQTAHGKLVQGVAHRARARGIPVVALCGSMEASAEVLRRMGVSAAFSIAPGPLKLEQALQRTAELLRRSARECCGLWLAAHPTN